MKISDKLTQQILLEILKVSYTKGQENQNIKVVDLLEEIKQKVLLAIDNK